MSRQPTHVPPSSVSQTVFATDLPNEKEKREREERKRREKENAERWTVLKTE
jgi:hypothetical protein